MLSRFASLLLIALALPAPARAEEIKVLWCTGGGFHDFKGLTPLLNESMRKYAAVRFDVSDDYKSWAKPGFADGEATTTLQPDQKVEVPVAIKRRLAELTVAVVTPSGDLLSGATVVGSTPTSSQPTGSEGGGVWPGGVPPWPGGVPPWPGGVPPWPGLLSLGMAQRPRRPLPTALLIQ